MLEVKWNLDAEQGRGFRLEKSTPLFSGSELVDYPGKLREFIQSAPHRTNEDIYRFGLEQGFSPKHTNEILRSWKGMLEVFTLDGKPVRGFYIGYDSERLVGIRLASTFFTL